MSYDDTDPPAPFAPLPPVVTVVPVDVTDGNDRLMVLTLLELAALELTPTEGTTFTRAEVIALAKEIGGEELALTDADLATVFDGSGFLRAEGDDRWVLK